VRDLEGRPRNASQRLGELFAQDPKRGSRVVARGSAELGNQPVLDPYRCLSFPPAGAHAVQEAIAAGEEVVALEMGPMRDLTRPADVVRHNFPYLLSEGE
jgi:hypothetical protein